MSKFPYVTFRYPHKVKVILSNGYIIDFRKGDYTTNRKDVIELLDNLNAIQRVEDKASTKASKGK